MPVFHTKVIESILEPVAQQVSKLVILHEEAEDGNAMPDLAMPVQTVKLAVDNLVRVGYDTINCSEDQILKQDMPPALNRVEEASLLLLQASQLLRKDPFSAPARKKLIEGSRGILQGTSALLLAFDESEVRKIIRVCKNVLEYLAIVEVVDRMEDLVTYVKNLSPVLTTMAKQVDGREKELTHQVHREMLCQSLDQVKNLTPVVISGIKIYITAKENYTMPQQVVDAQSNRDYMVNKMRDEIHEIIRVLQLTTYDEEEWDANDLAIMRKLQSAIDQKIKPANDWLADTTALVGGSGDKSLRQILDDSRRVADRCTDPDDRDQILKTVGDMESMTNALSELRQQGKGSSPQAMSLARQIQSKLHELQRQTQNAILKSERSGIRRPAPTVEGKVEQARQWLSHPGMDDRGLGEQATRMIVAEGRRVADSCPGSQRSELLRLCDETEILTSQLSDLIRKGQGDSPQGKALAKALTEKLHALKYKIQEALVSQVADDFIDISMPLKNMTDAAMTPLGTPGRDANFADKARQFEDHSSRLADTANMVATKGGCRNKKTVEAIFKSSAQVNDLTPQVVTAARIVLADPNNAAARDHFDLMKRQWTDNMEHLRSLVDEAVDTPAHLKAVEEAILRDTDRVEDGIRTNDPAKMVTNGSNIARRANRVLQVAHTEAENSEDPQFVDQVNQAAENLKSTISPMVQNAKAMSMNPKDGNAVNNWRKANQNLISAVGGVRDIFHEEPGYDQFPPPPPDLSQLHITDHSMPPLPPPPIWPSQEFSEIFNLGRSPASAYGPTSATYSPVVVDSPPHRNIMARVPDQFADGSHMMPQPEATMRQQEAYPGQFAPPAPPPPVPPPPQDHFGYYGRELRNALANRSAASPNNRSGVYPIDRSDRSPEVLNALIFHPDGAPPRPPLPTDSTPPRPPPPDTDDEEDMIFPSVPQANQPIMMAAHALHMETKQWSSKDNEIIGAAKRMAILMAKLSQLVRGEGGTKKDLISTAKKIAEASEEVTRLAKKLAAECTDKKMRTNLLQVCERIPTIGTQLKILSTVKATMLGAQGSEEDQEATEMLVGNAQNLMQAVKETVRAAEAASIKIRVDSGYTIRWLRKRPWYTS